MGFPTRTNLNPCFVACADGSLEAGLIDEAAAAAINKLAAPIRIEDGIAGPRGYGLLHIESNKSRVALIQTLGFRTAKEFVEHICANWNVISDTDEADRIAISIGVKGYSYKAVLELCDHKGTAYWCVVTALPTRPIKQGILFTR